jgi:hypothetical protein
MFLKPNSTVICKLSPTTNFAFTIDMTALDLTLGAMEVGILISSVLFGMTTVQVYNYYKLDYKDNIYVHGLVCQFTYYNENFVIN